jgi:hypothetical protein
MDHSSEMLGSKLAHNEPRARRFVHGSAHECALDLGEARSVGEADSSLLSALGEALSNSIHGSGQECPLDLGEARSVGEADSMP